MMVLILFGLGVALYVGYKYINNLDSSSSPKSTSQTIYSKNFETVPTFEQYYPSTQSMSERQKRFFDHWLSEWKKGNPVDIEGNISYLFVYTYDLLTLHEKDKHRKLLNELQKLQEAYQNEDKFYSYIGIWICDTYILLGELKKAFHELEKVSMEPKKICTLKKELNIPVKGKDILNKSLLPTQYGKENINQAYNVLTEMLREYEKEHNDLLTETLASKSGSMFVYAGSPIQDYIDMDLFQFDEQKIEDTLGSNWTRKVENRLRDKNNLPKIGEGWISETKLKNITSKLLEPLGYEVKHRASPNWLGQQHLDIYVPDINLAIEYMGRQHYEAIEHFGGAENLDKVKQNDRKKVEKCERNQINLIHFKYDEPIKPKYVAKQITDATPLNIKDIDYEIEVTSKEELQSYRDERVKEELNTQNNEVKEKSENKEKKNRKKLERLEELEEYSSSTAYHEKGEILRKLGRVKEAEKAYRSSIELWEKKNVFPPAPFRELAKLYYHTGYKDEALEVLDLYLEFTRQKGSSENTGRNKKRKNLRKLRKRMASNDFRRLKNKYDEKPNGNPP